VKLGVFRVSVGGGGGVGLGRGAGWTGRDRRGG